LRAEKKIMKIIEAYERLIAARRSQIRRAFHISRAEYLPYDLLNSILAYMKIKKDPSNREYSNEWEVKAALKKIMEHRDLKRIIHVMFIDPKSGEAEYPRLDEF